MEKTKSFLLYTFIGISLFAMSSTMFSCGKSNSSPATDKDTSKTVMIKVTLSSTGTLPSGAGFTGSLGGLLSNSKDAVWIVNGVTRVNESAISLGDGDFKDGVLTIQSSTKVTNAFFDVSLVTAGSSVITAVVETTINGKALTPITIKTGDTSEGIAIRDFSY